MSITLEIDQKFFRHLENISGKDVKIAFYVVIGTLQDFFVKYRKFMNLFALSAKTSGFLVENFWQECQNCNLLVQRKFVKKNDILKKECF